LKSQGLYDRSIIILASDHGDATGEFGRSTHSHFLYPEIMRVPLIVHLPESMKGKFVDDRDGVVTLTDVAPSLYYLLGHRPIVRNPLYGRPLFVETRRELESYRRNEILLASDELAIYGLLDGGGRYFYATYDSPPRSFLFDLAQDPNAEHSILTPDLKRQYDQRILDQLRTIADFYGYRPGVQSWFESRRKLF
jgi:arylsulfatase A-like enzyme